MPDRALDSIAYPLDTASYLNKNFLPPGLLLEKDIIGLGEATHGTKEFYVIKDCIIRNQVLFNNVRALAIESDFCGMLRFNDYLLDNSKSLQSLYMEFDKSGIYGIYFTGEMYNLFRWIKTYNLKQSDNSEKVHVYGIDMQDPYAITKCILDNYSSLKEKDAGIYSELEDLNRLYFPRKEIKLEKKDIYNYISLSDTIASLIKQNTQKKDNEILLRCVELLKQTFELRLHNNNIDVKKRYDFYKDAREVYMADNCLWVYSYLSEHWKDPHCKLVVWAHNGHVAFGSIDNDYPMGYFINKKNWQQIWLGRAAVWRGRS
jgi:erythromycin esterase